MPTDYLQRIVNLERCDYDTIKQVAQNRGLGKKGFSAALRLIIREWKELNSKISYPVR